MYLNAIYKLAFVFTLNKRKILCCLNTEKRLQKYKKNENIEE